MRARAEPQHGAAAPGAPGGRLAALYGIAVAAFALFASGLALLEHDPLPLDDEWRLLDQSASLSVPAFVLSDQNGHRIPFTLVFYALDHSFLGARHWLPDLALVACPLLGALLFWRWFRPECGLTPPEARVLLGFLVFTLYFSGFDSTFHLELGLATEIGRLLVLATLVPFAGFAGHHPREPGDWRVPTAFAALAGFVATFNYGAGALTWPALLAVAIVARLPVGAIASLVGAAGLTLALYALGLAGSPYSTPDSLTETAFSVPLDVVEFATAFVGTPVARVVWGLVPLGVPAYYGLSLLAGVLGLGFAAVYGILLVARPARIGRLDLLAVALLAFSAGSGVLVAVSRLPKFPPETAVASRYLGWQVLFWAGAVCAGAAAASRRGRSGWILAGIPLLSLLMLPVIPKHRALREAEHGMAAEASLALLLGVENEKLARKLGPYPDQIWRVTARLRERRESLFADGFSRLPGSRLLDALPETDPGRCEGEIRLRDPVGDAAVRITGFAVDRARGEPPGAVAVVDSSGVVRGLALFTRRRRPGDPGAAGRAGSGFGGLLAGYQPGERYTAYGLVDGRSTACRFAEIEGQPRSGADTGPRR